MVLDERVLQYQPKKVLSLTVSIFGILNQIVKFVGWKLAITTATMILGAVIAQAWPLLAYGFAGVSAVMIGYELITIGMLTLAPSQSS